ncbi:MAG: TPM domain-containing protein [Phascolarctobacterium sp.]|nr:TPM domain-containing protein [Phascolarctobacterium sp.]
MKKIFLVLSLLLSFLFSCISFAAAPSLDDGAKLLKTSERILLEKELQRVEKEHGIRCVVVTRKSIGGAVPGEYANKLNKQVYNDAPNGAILFLQVTEVRKWYISTYGNARAAVVGTDGVEYMSKQIVPYLKKNEHKNAYMTFAQRADELLKFKNEKGEAWTPDSQETDPTELAILGGAMVGIPSLVSGFWAKRRRKKREEAMSNVNFSKAADPYLNGDSFELTNESNKYLYSITTTHTESDDDDDDDDDDGSVSDSSSDGDCDGGGGDY